MSFIFTNTYIHTRYSLSDYDDIVQTTVRSMYTQHESDGVLQSTVGPLRKYSQSIQMLDVAFAQLKMLVHHDVAHVKVGVTRSSGIDIQGA